VRRSLISRVSQPRLALIASLALLAGAWSWVKLSPEGESVRVATAAQVATCKTIGTTHSKTSSKAWIFARGQKSIDQEVEFLARNEAANMGGNTIVAQGPTSSEGRRSFDVYRCR
jgi:hypothetical protein